MGEMLVEDVIRRIQDEAQSASGQLRWVRVCRPGDEIRQGDVYLYPITPPRRFGRSRKTLQLADGVTAGSRHIIDGGAMAFESRAQFDPLAGPLVLAWERVTLTHPEHAHISLPAGWYEVRYQRDYSARAEDAAVQRVWD